MRTFIRKSFPFRMLIALGSCVNWGKRHYAAPSPHFIKQACVVRNGYPNATWVETGTYLGETTKVLARSASKVYSIEPEPTLFANAKNYFNGDGRVEILNGLSEDVLPTLLPRIRGDVNFWLDGHYSEGRTFKGPRDTPILDELRNIGENLGRFDRICVLIDDIRCFDPDQPATSTYPSIDVLVDWARRNDLHWHIEHDIFVAKSRTNSTAPRLDS